MKQQRGFTLVEMMAVVAIIGLLLALGIPMYKKHAARAAQTYAKSELAGIYTAEANFETNYNTYSPLLNGVGFVPEGMSFVGSMPVIASTVYRYHAVGVDVPGQSPCVWPSSLALPDSSSNGSVYQASDPNATEVFYWFTQDSGTYTHSQLCDHKTFIATAGGFVRIGSGANDIWTINQDRLLKNEQSGL